jgi:hypothetical protein
MDGPSTPLPTLDFSFGAPAFEWPLPPWAHRGTMASLPEDGVDAAVACHIETLTGVAVEGEMVTFDAEAQCVRFRVVAGSETVALPFSRFRRLTLTAPWALAKRSAGAVVERVPVAAQERDYWIDLPGGGHLAGRTMGHRSNELGLFLFVPNKEGSALLRVFVPQHACACVAFGKSIEQAATERWIATPEALLAAVESQRHARILSVGDALIELGFVSHGVIEMMLHQQGPGRDAPLGEMLVAAGFLDRADLQTALAHKMGYPMVDLTRFPIDPSAARRLSHRTMVEHRVLPLMQRDKRLFVAVDALSAIPPLQGLQALSALEIVPVLTPRGRLTIELAGLPQRLGLDVWASNVPQRQ